MLLLDVCSLSDSLLTSEIPFEHKSCERIERAYKVYLNSVESFLSYSDLIFELTNIELDQFARQNRPLL